MRSHASNVNLWYPSHLKPIVVVSVDVGPDENPRFPKTLAYRIQKFKDHNLDILITLCHAPGNSAFNPAGWHHCPEIWDAPVANR